MNADTKGVCYLIHFDRPHRHARHYLGWTVDLDARMARHRAGSGARLLRVLVEAGVAFAVVRVWEGATLADERRLKAYGGHARLCPVCRAEAKAKKEAA